MYHMKNIVSFDNEVILPKCMYNLRKICENQLLNEKDINISNQVNTFLKQAPNTKMAELEERQDQLLKKLDILYDKIKMISTYCKYEGTNHLSTPVAETKRDNNLVYNVITEEIVLILNPDSLPWFLNIYLKQTKDLNILWHIHSSVPNEKKPKINAFLKKFGDFNTIANKNINLRVIFKSIEADSELRLSSLEIPIVGMVNILRYLALAYPKVVFYDFKDYQMDSLLDLCCLLERSSEKNKESFIKKLFSQQKDWIYANTFSIVDLAVYNIVKQWQNSAKYVPKKWFENCEKNIF